MKKLIFLFAFTLSLFGATNVNAQYLYRHTIVSADTLNGTGDSTIFTMPSGNEFGSTFASGCIIEWTIYTKAISGTTSTLTAYHEVTNFVTSEAKWARQNASNATLQVVAGTFTQAIAPFTTYSRNGRLVVKITGTSPVRIVGASCSIRKRT